MPGESEFFLSELVKIPLRLIEGDDGAATEEETGAYAAVPLVILFENHGFRSLCGSHYLASLRKEKKNAHQAFIFVRNKEYGYYLNHFGKQFQR